MLRRAYASLGLKVGCVWRRVPGGKPAQSA